MKQGIAIAGTISLDEIKRIERYPNKSELATIKSIQRSAGGAVSNCSFSLAHMDPELPIEVIALIGNDEKGHFLKRKLEGYQNINMSQVQMIGDTPFTDVIQDESDHTRTFFHYRGNSVFFDENTIDFTTLNAKILHIAYILLLQSLDKQDSEYGTKMARLLKKAQDYGIKTSIDIVSENSERYSKIVPPSLQFTNYCIINELEAGKTAGMKLRHDNGELAVSNISKVLYKLKELGVKDWVVIHTPEGSFGFDGIKEYRLPSLSIDSKLIKGTVGAGDAYLSGVLYGALKGMSLQESMKIGTAAAASSLFAEDSTTGVKTYRQLMEMYGQFPLRKEFQL